MADYGIKVSEEGFDVNTAEDKNLSMKSGMTLLKVYDQQSISVSNTGWNDISHPLGYIPQYLVFVKTSSDIAYLGTGIFSSPFEAPVAITKINTTTLSIYKTGTVVAYYYIFYEPAETGSAPSIVSTNNYGIKVSKDGVGVKTANILQQTFNSEKNSLKILSDGTQSSTASGGRSIDVAHGLSFVPGFLLFYEVDNSGYWISNGTAEDLSGKSCWVEGHTDGTNLTLEMASSSSATIKIHYYILADPGEEV